MKQVRGSMQVLDIVPHCEGKLVQRKSVGEHNIAEKTTGTVQVEVVDEAGWPDPNKDGPVRVRRELGSIYMNRSQDSMDSETGVIKNYFQEIVTRLMYLQSLNV